MKNARIVRKRYIGLIFVLIVLLIAVIGGGAYWFISADSLGLPSYTSPPQVSGNCSAADMNLVVDTSGSVQKTASEYKQNLIQFVRNTEANIPDTNWSLTTFDSRATVKNGWTKDPTGVITSINQISPYGSTATASGIKSALDQGSANSVLNTNNQAKIMLIITDGIPNVALNGSPNTIEASRDAITEANAARAAGYSTVVVDVSSGTKSNNQNDILRGLAGTDVPTIAGNIIPATFANLSSSLADAFGCQTNTVSITKTVDNATPIVGTDVNYTITVTNNNTADEPKATNINIDDTLPAGLTLKSATPSLGTFTSPNWVIPSLDQGQSATLKMKVTVNSSDTVGQAIVNTTKITQLDQDDNNTADNTATATVTPKKKPANDIVAITKVVNNSTPQVGTDIEYTITVKNLNATGGDDATNIVVSDTLPSGVTFKSAQSPTTGVYTDPKWTIPSLKAGQDASIVITATVSKDDTPDVELKNTATIVSLDQEDDNPDNNTATATVTPKAEPTEPTTPEEPTPQEPSTPEETSAPAPKVIVKATATGPDTNVVYSISAILSLLVLGGLYLLKNRK